MKIVLVGNWRWPWYEQACASALSELGHEVTRLSGDEKYLPGWTDGRYTKPERNTLAQVQERLLVGPLISTYNARLKQAIQKVQPDIVWIYNCRWVREDTLEQAKKAAPQAEWVLYANDDPFGRKRWPDFWRHFRPLIPKADLVLAYRASNLADFREYGARRTDTLRSYFVPSEDFRLPISSIEQGYKSDVVFTGHFEPDGRLEALEALSTAGHHVRVFGGAWEPVQYRVLQGPLADQWPISVRFTYDYRQSICGSKIALCFLSKANRDTYTRRNFQIPAMGTFMLSEHSADLETMFTEGVDAEFFRDQDELLDKATFYLRNDEARNTIARRGQERVHRDGHDVTSRMRQFIAMTEPRKTFHGSTGN